ncbi:MAG: class I SAM-dependent methyltransferase [Candidatus Helarchaeota archaeon]
MDSIGKMFEKEAQEYDETIKKIIPFYEQMLNTLTMALPFPTNKDIKVVDLGCGTGTLALKIKEKYPRARILCLDMAEGMINLAKQKLKKYSDIRFQKKDFHVYDFEESNDVIISSLALHHLQDDNAKKNFLKKIFDSLSVGGVFYNADVVFGANKFLENLNLLKWKEYMNENYSLKEINDELLPKYYHDLPTQLVKQVQWLVDLGFIDVDVIWKYFHFVIYGGLKPEI